MECDNSSSDSSSGSGLYLAATNFEFDGLIAYTYDVLGDIGGFRRGYVMEQFESLDYSLDISCDEGYNDCTVVFRRTKPEHMMLWSFMLKPFPGNRGIAVSTATEVHESLRGHGIGRYLRNVKDRVCRKAGYSVVQCTTELANERQNRILRDDKWSVTSEFNNSLTGHRCLLWTKNL